MNTLLSLIKQIQERSQELLNYLELEKQAIDNNEFETLSDISAKKIELLEQLEQLDQQRIANTPENNFNNFIKTSGDQALLSQWKLTKEAIANCHHQNEVNGRLLNCRNQINQDVLHILTGRTNTKEETYDAQGNQENQTSLLHGIKA